MAPRKENPEVTCTKQQGSPPPKPAPRPDPIKEIEKLKISESISERIESGTVTEQRFDNYDKYWLEKLKCIDDTHSSINQIDIREAERLLKKLRRYQVAKPKPFCPFDRTAMTSCLQANCERTLECAEEVRQFVNCVDILLYQVARNSPIGVKESKKDRALSYSEQFHRY